MRSSPDPLADTLSSGNDRSSSDAGREDSRRLTQRFFLAWLGLIILGTFALRRPGVMVHGQELSFDRSVFLAVNAATLTGFQQSVGMNEFNPESMLGQSIVLTLIVGGSFFTLTTGGFAVVRLLRLPYSRREVIGGAGLCILLTSMAGAAAMIGPGRGLFDSLFQSTAAFANCGLATGRVTGLLDGRTYLLLALAVAGGLGLPVLMELYDTLWSPRMLSKHAHIVLRSSAATYLIAFCLLLLLQLPMGRGAAWATWREVLASSSAEALNTRTAGLHLEPLRLLPQAAQWLLMLLMMVGANSAGTASGLKLTTLVQLCHGVRDTLHGRRVRREFGIAAVWFAIYLALVGCSFLSLLALDPDIAPGQMLFTVISAASNVGLSHDPISTVGPGLFVLSAVMLLGRIAPLAILLWMADTAEGAETAVG